MSLGTNWPPSSGQWAVRFEDSWATSQTSIDPDAKRVDELCESLVWLMEHAADSSLHCPVVGDGPFRIAKAKAPDGSVLRALFTIRSPGNVSAWVVGRVPAVPDDQMDEDDSNT